jgi:hypothetical protein
MVMVGGTQQDQRVHGHLFNVTQQGGFIIFFPHRSHGNGLIVLMIWRGATPSTVDVEERRQQLWVDVVVLYRIGRGRDFSRRFVRECRWPKCTTN